MTKKKTGRKNPHAVAMRKAGVNSLSAAQRSEIARKAALARWGKRGKKS